MVSTAIGDGVGIPCAVAFFCFYLYQVVYPYHPFPYFRNLYILIHPLMLSAFAHSAIPILFSYSKRIDDGYDVLRIDDGYDVLLCVARDVKHYKDGYRPFTNAR